MGNSSLALLLTVGIMASFTDLPEKVEEIIDDSILAGQQIATAGDLRTMSIMLDAHYFKRGRYPREEKFEQWLTDTFRESHPKELSRDHWGNLYLYSAPGNGKSFLLVSLGQDGIENTEDDMKVSGP